MPTKVQGEACIFCGEAFFGPDALKKAKACEKLGVPEDPYPIGTIFVSTYFLTGREYEALIEDTMVVREKNLENQPYHNRYYLVVPVEDPKRREWWEAYKVRAAMEEHPQKQ